MSTVGKTTLSFQVGVFKVQFLVVKVLFPIYFKNVGVRLDGSKVMLLKNLSSGWK